MSEQDQVTSCIELRQPAGHSANWPCQQARLLSGQDTWAIDAPAIQTSKQFIGIRKKHHQGWYFLIYLSMLVPFVTSCDHLHCTLYKLNISVAIKVSPPYSCEMNTLQ
ncbi:hypothetical protein O5D80_005221 [Batrachochytrium dendrobatidis]|nr:hypothetical protein O5D80_005221 [Batrachochytrium dendrobatidis]